MAYNEQLADRIREALADIPKVKEKKMFRGVVFMVNGKMCVNVSHDDMMCRVAPELRDMLLEKNGVSPFIMGKSTSKSFIMVSEEGFRTKREFDYWIQLCLDFNDRAKASKKKKPVAKKKVVKKKLR